MFGFLKKKILVVEDSEPLIKAIKLQLGRSGFRVVTARSFEEAEKQLATNKGFKAVWLDHYLIGDKSGLDVLKYIKEDTARFGDIPIFVVSAIDQEIRKDYEALGVTRLYIKAEYQLGAIIREIRTILKHGVPEMADQDPFL